MALSDVLTYIGILIAILALSQEYFRLRLKLAPKLLQIIFWISLVLIYLLAFNVIRDFVGNNKIHGLSFLYEGRGDFLLISFHFIALLSIIFLGKLRKTNQKQFYNLVIELVNNRDYVELFKVLDGNIRTLLRLKYKIGRKDKVLKIFDNQIYFFDYGEPTDERETSKIGRLLTYIKNQSESILHTFLFEVLKLKYCEDSYANATIELITDTKIAKVLAQKNEILGFKIIKLFLKNAKYKNRYGLSSSISDAKDFSEKFLVAILEDSDSILSYEIQQDAGYGDKEPDGKYIKFLLENSDKLGLEKCIDVSISNLLKNDEIKKNLNEPFSNTEYDRNVKLIHHFWNLLELFEKIDKEKLVMSNTFLFLLKDFVNITDFSLDNWHVEQERNSGSSYLILELFDFCETINEKNDLKYLLIYYIMLEWVLTNVRIPDSLKKQIVYSYYYFLVDGTDDQIKLKFSGREGQNVFPESLKGIVNGHPEIRKYFKMDVHDRITHNLHRGGGIRGEIFEFIDSIE